MYKDFCWTSGRVSGLEIQLFGVEIFCYQIQDQDQVAKQFFYFVVLSLSKTVHFSTAVVVGCVDDGITNIGSSKCLLAHDNPGSK